MLIDLSVEASFTRSSKQVANHVRFQGGLTSVQGKNGAGKTFTAIEAPRWLLFGSRALRGVKADYTSLAGRLSFTVRSATYEVARSDRKESLTDAEGVVLAVGADAVNKKIVELFGYGLDVFDVANACTQSEVTRLADMTPGERKAMVDSLVGLDKVEAAEKACREEAKGLLREVEALRGALPAEPVLPLQPRGNAKPSELEHHLKLLRATAETRTMVLAAIAAVGAEPTAPVSPVPGRLQQLERHEAQRLTNVSLEASLRRRLMTIPVTKYTAEELDEAEAYATYLSEVRLRGAHPTISAAEAEAGLDHWARYEAAQKAVICPECAATFVPGAGKIDVVEQPRETKTYLRSQIAANLAWEDAPVEPSRGRTLPPGALIAGRAALAGATERADIEAQLAEIEVGVDKSNDLAVARRIAQEWQAYLTLKADYDRRAEAARGLRVPEDPSKEIERLQELLEDVRRYDREMAAYTAAQGRYDEAVAEIGVRRFRATGFDAGAKACKELRVEFRTHIAPAIGMVASQLVNAMTGGEFDRIEVTGDFDVTVNGQPLRTLSGSEAAVAGLALRVGLGQVLTGKVFPVFLGDEIDASMDAERAEYTAAAFRGLANVLKQVILVSHKEIEADHMICV